ncbi:MAG TPA: C-terminal binding protein [Planctomycetaceae bacterium]|nr:C-terminal binding protein [Planctomycetaceae bacterium]
MSKFTAVRLSARTYPIGDIEREVLAQADIELIGIEGQEPDEIVSAARDADALMVISSRVPGTVIDELRKCRVIARMGAGTDKIDIAAATRRGIVVTNVPDFCINEQAEHTLMLLLAFERKLPYMTDAMRRGFWTARSHPEVHRVAGQTLGLIGFGASAQAVAQRAAAFGLRVVACVRNPEKYATVAKQRGVQLVSFDELLATSDYISLHVPLTPETRGMLDANRIRQMKPTAVLINTARGALVDESALTVALQERKIRGAALDVFEQIDVFAEPGDPPAHPLLELDNVILTPHCAGSSVESGVESQQRGTRNLVDVLNGRRPKHVVNPEVYDVLD